MACLGNLSIGIILVTLPLFSLLDYSIASNNLEGHAGGISVFYRMNLKSPLSRAEIRHVLLNTEKKGQTSGIDQIESIPSKSNVFPRTLDTEKLKKVCKLLQTALGRLQELSPSKQEGVTSKLNDKSPKGKSKPKIKPKPPLCFFPWGCGGCCLMRPFNMYKVKYTPPKYKMKPLKPKTKCGNPHYGIYLGRRRR